MKDVSTAVSLQTIDFKRKNKRPYCFLKRTFDIIASLMALIVLSPLFIIITMAIKISTRGPAIFKQNRVGKDNKEFVIYKFRTMKKDAPEVASGSLNNPELYITEIGKVLRKTSIDELPQLVNILKGDMSIVGPRPVINNESEYRLLVKRETYGINKIIPGLTGWAQINGRDQMNIEDKIYYEYEYLKRRSFLFDIKIIFMTLIKV